MADSTRTNTDRVELSCVVTVALSTPASATESAGAIDALTVQITTLQSEGALDLTTPAPSASMDAGTALSRTITDDAGSADGYTVGTTVYQDSDSSMALSDAEPTVAGGATPSTDVGTDALALSDADQITEIVETITDDEDITQALTLQGVVNYFTVTLSEPLDLTDVTDALTPGKLVIVAGEVTAEGGTVALITDARMTTLAGGGTASGGSVSMFGVPRDATFSIDTGEVAASGREVSLLSGGDPVEADLVVYAEVEVALSQSPGDRYYPELVTSRVSQFQVEPWRVVEGTPESAARYVTEVQFDAVVGSAQPADAFLAPADWVSRAPFRWLAEDFAMPEWYPNGDVSTVNDIRTWDDVASTFTWATMANRTWDEVLYSTLDLGQPSWVPYGAEDPTLAAAYQYWRAGQYVTSPAVVMGLGTSMGLSWAPAATPAQMTVIVVLVPRAPDLGNYEILSANDSIRVVLNADSTMDLLYGGRVLTTQAIGARTRPNEPIAVALSVSAFDRRIILGISDTTVRTVDSVVPDELSIPGLAWRLCSGASSKLELLEASLYVDLMGPADISRELSALDRVYGVTLA